MFMRAIGWDMLTASGAGHADGIGGVPGSRWQRDGQERPFMPALLFSSFQVATRFAIDCCCFACALLLVVES